VRCPAKDLAALDRLLANPRRLAPTKQARDKATLAYGRPTIPLTSLERLL
jgi:hypothetical protein